MADFATLDAIGFSELFYYRAEVAKYRGKGFSDEELEERASNILLDAWLSWDWGKNGQKQFCNYCRKSLLSLIRPAQRHSIFTSIEDESCEIASPLPDVSDSVMKLIDVGFLESWERLVADIFSDNDLLHQIAQKHFIEGKTLHQTALELGFKGRGGVWRYVSEISYRIRDWILKHKGELYSYFDEQSAEVIIDMATAC